MCCEQEAPSIDRNISYDPHNEFSLQSLKQLIIVQPNQRGPHLDVSQCGQPLRVPDGVLAPRQRGRLAADLIPVGGPREEDDACRGSLKTNTNEPLRKAISHYRVVHRSREFKAVILIT